MPQDDVIGIEWSCSGNSSLETSPAALFDMGEQLIRVSPTGPALLAFGNCGVMHANMAHGNIAQRQSEYPGRLGNASWRSGASNLGPRPRQALEPWADPSSAALGSDCHASRLERLQLLRGAAARASKSLKLDVPDVDCPYNRCSSQNTTVICSPDKLHPVLTKHGLVADLAL